MANSGICHESKNAYEHKKIIILLTHMKNIAKMKNIIIKYYSLSDFIFNHECEGIFSLLKNSVEVKDMWWDRWILKAR